MSGQPSLPFTINFENVSTAQAAARRIRITDQLDANLDWRTFRLVEVGFNNYRVQVPQNRAFFQGRLQLGSDLGNLLADISAGLDIFTGRVTWTLTALDPNTGEQPASALLGLLPPNDQRGRGQGYVTFTIQPKTGLATGTPLTNLATITFDTEEPIVTNTVLNTIDADGPSSAVAALPPSSPSAFTLSWTGDDVAGGSGLKNFDIWVAEDNGPYQLLLNGTTQTSAQFTGQMGKTYRFYSIARDNAGNVEAAPNNPDTVTTIGQVVINPAPTLTSINPNRANPGGAQFTLTIDGANFITASVVNWNGSPRATAFGSATQLTAMITAADIANAGTAQITVVNPPPGGGTSAAATFTINALPVITPAAALARQQGSAGVVAPIAMVSDAETAAGNLLVNVTSAPQGIVITNLTNTNGVVTANIVVGCGAALGANVVVLSVTDGLSATATANFIVNVAANTPPLLVYGSPQNVSVNGSNAFGPLSGPADNGTIVSLVLQSVTPNFTGNISVTPAGVVSVSNAPGGSYTVTVRAMDNCGAVTNAQFTLNVGNDCPTITLAPETLPNGAVGATYNQTISVSSGGTYSFSVTSGALPSGLSLNATGALTGTPTQAGSYNFRITAANGSCNGARNYTLVIGCAAVTLAPETLPNAAAGANYNQTITASPAGAYNFAVTSGSLPSGLTLNGQTGVLSGLTTTLGTYNFTVRAQTTSGCSGTRNYTLVIACPTVTISPATLPNGAIGVSYSQTLSATPPGGGYSYAVTAGALPVGLMLSPASGLLSGTPSSAGTFNFTVKATGANSCSGMQTYTITIPSSCQTVTLSDLSGGTVGAAYNQIVMASPAGLYNYTVTAGSLPPGLTLYNSIGLIYGYPTTAGTYNFTITATAGNCTVSRNYIVTIGLGFTPLALRDATVGLAYNQSFAPLGTTGPVIFSLAGGKLPQGTSLAPDGRISGTPNERGRFPIKLQVSDLTGMSGTGEMTLKVNDASAPVVNASIGDPLSCLRAGSTVNGNVTVANNGANAQPATLTIALPPQLLALAGTCRANTGKCSVDSATTITWGGVVNAGQTATINYSAQVADGIAAGAQLCATATAGFAGGTTATAPACLTLNCPTIGPGLPLAVDAPSDQKAGSVLVYNLYTSASDPTQQNTRVSLTNTDTARLAYVHLFFVDGATCSVADSYVCLTPNQTMSFLASDLDPGTTGFIVAMAVNRNGCPISFNHLIGNAYVKLSSGHAANLSAEAIPALAGGLPACDTNSSTAVLNFNGVSYGRLPRVLALDNIASRADGNDTLLVINRIHGNLGTGTSALSSIFGILFSDTENSLSFSFNPGMCQFRSVISNNFPRTAPRFEQFIPAGRSGWLKFWSDADAAILGAALNFNANASVNAGAFKQGHNLHKLTLTNAAVLTIPVFPPSC